MLIRRVGRKAGAVVAVMVVLVATMTVGVAAAAATTRTWTGGGQDNLWSNPANWNAGPPVAGDALVFPGAAQNTARNDLPAGTAFTSISIDGSYTLDGNGIGLSQGLHSQNGTQFVRMPIDLTASQAFEVGANTNLILSSDMDLQGHTLSISGSGVFQTSFSTTAACSAGAQCITGGTLRVTSGVSGVNTDSSTLTVSVTGGQFDGSGRIGPLHATGGRVAANYPGGNLLQTGSLTLDAPSTLAASICGTAPGAGCSTGAPGQGGGYSQVRVTGAVTIDDAALSLFGRDYVPTVGQAFTLIDNDGTDPVAGTFSGAVNGRHSGFSCSANAGTTWQASIDYAGGTGNDVVATITSVTPTNGTCAGTGGGDPDPTPTPPGEGEGSQLPEGTATISGTVRLAPDATPASGSSVQACTDAGCAWATSDGDGEYTIGGLPAGDYTLTAFPPDGDTRHSHGYGEATLATGASATEDITLPVPAGPPPGTSIETARPGPNGIPSIYMGAPTDITTEGCANATSASYRVVGTDGSGQIVRTGTLAPTTPGGTTYTGTIAALQPMHGTAQISFTFDCGQGPEETTPFNVYIDPSGHVVDQNGRPIVGATVVLLRSDAEAGPFTVVPDGSDVMSPSNRKNPDATDGTGHFGWDVLAGYYKVEASKAGCTSTESRVMEIPPPVTDLLLVLNCPTAPPAGPGFDPGAGGGTTGAPATGDSQTTLAGQDRIGTSIVASRDNFASVTAGQLQAAAITAPTRAQAVVLASADAFPDGLVSAPFATASTAPVLLTHRDELDPRVLEEIRRILPSGGRIHLIGGTAAISDAIVAQLRGRAGYDVSRIAGADRYATSVAVASAMGERTTILVATGRNFADALAAGAAASAVNGAVVLTDGSRMPDAVASYIAAHPAADRFAIGGPAGSADKVARMIAGPDRYATAAEVARTFFSKPTVVGVASGEDFPDALSGAAHIGLRGGPLLLVRKGDVPAASKAYLDENATSITTTYVYGGTAVISPEVAMLVKNG